MESKIKRDMRDVFEAACLRHLSFLSEEFAFKIVFVEKDCYGCFITYQNNTTALKANFCPLDGWIRFDFYRITDGKIPKYPIFFNPHDELLVFNFDDLTLLKNGIIVKHEQKDLFDPDSIERIVKEYAELLRRFASDLFLGDFSVLPQIKEIISRRVKERAMK